jgi:geranylgeranylglycerol-phosphate geranylgeranyltransferase
LTSTPGRSFGATDATMDLVRLTRPVDALLFLAAALLGGWLAAGGGALDAGAISSLFGAAIAAVLIGIAGNVINDVFDIEVDRQNAPWRPLPAGAVSLRTARVFWVLLSVTGVGFAFAVSVVHGVVAAGACVVLWAYSAWLKRVPLLGHAVVGGVVAMGLAFGALAVEPDRDSRQVVTSALVLTFVLVTAREVVKAIPDVDGDRAHGVVTLPVVIGARTSALFVAGVGFATVAALPSFPALGYDTLFLAYSIPLAALLLRAGWILIATSAAVRGGPALWRVSAAQASRWMKLALAVGTAALALGRTA